MSFLKAEYKVELNTFWQFFPKDFVLNVLLPETNKQLDTKLKLGEFT